MRQLDCPFFKVLGNHGPCCDTLGALHVGRNYSHLSSEDLAAVTYFITSHVGVISVLLRTVFTSLLPTLSFSS